MATIETPPQKKSLPFWKIILFFLLMFASNRIVKTLMHPSAPSSENNSLDVNKGISSSSRTCICPICGATMENVSYIEYMGFIQQVNCDIPTGICKACALRRKQAYQNGLSTQ